MSSFATLCTFIKQANETAAEIHEIMEKEIDAHGKDWKNYIDIIVHDYAERLDDRQILLIIYSYGMDVMENEFSKRGRFVDFRQMARHALYQCYEQK